MITGLAALAALAAADTYAVTAAGRFASVSLGLATASIVLLVLGLLLRLPSTIPWALLAAAAGYLVGIQGRDTVDGWAAVIGVALLLAAELASWSIDHDKRIRSERALVVRRAATLAVLAAVALFVNFMLLAAAAVTAAAGTVVAAVGVAAAVTAVAIVLRLVRT
ncbi:MAG TPA: hypothetical protein VIJ70_05425 [Gaiellaceae bacterium]